MSKNDIINFWLGIYLGIYLAGIFFILVVVREVSKYLGEFDKYQKGNPFFKAPLWPLFLIRGLIRLAIRNIWGKK